MKELLFIGWNCKSFTEQKPEKADDCFICSTHALGAAQKIVRCYDSWSTVLVHENLAHYSTKLHAQSLFATHIVKHKAKQIDSHTELIDTEHYTVVEMMAESRLVLATYIDDCHRPKLFGYYKPTLRSTISVPHSLDVLLYVTRITDGVMANVARLVAQQYDTC